MTLKRWALPLSLLLVAACSGEETEQTAASKAPEPVGETSRDAGVVNVYSARHYDNDLVVFENFENQTGIKVNLIEGRGDGLIERIASEGEASPADIFMTADAGILWRAQDRDLFRPTDDAALEAAIPASRRHPDGQWFGLTKRARIVIYNKEIGLPEGLARYEDLADPAYKGMICVRPSSSVYNQSLLASIIAHLGAEQAQVWAEGVVGNFARKPQGNDTAQIEAVAAGICELGIVNSYYVARFVGADDPQAAQIGEKIGVLFPNQGADEEPGRGAHVNISGAGILKYAPNPENALALLRFLASEEVQASFASGNNEYPVREGVVATGPVINLGDFIEDDLPVTALGENQREAVMIFDRAGWL